MNTAYKIRASIMFIMISMSYVFIMYTLYLIQYKKQSFFTKLGQQQYQVSLSCPPERALIFDRNAKPLALNAMMVSAFILPKKLEYKKELEHFLKKHFPLSLKRLQKNKDTHFLFIKRKLTNAQQALIEKANLSDIHLLKEPHRFYTLACAGPIVGITDIDNVGLFGIEQICHEKLAGKSTTCVVERDARSGYYYFSKQTTIEGNKGTDIKLTLDAQLQTLAFERLKDTVLAFQAQEGAVLIINPENGDILTMAQYPTIDPNITEQLMLEHAKNKIVTESYELGSVMKVFVALAALEEELVTTEELIDCENVKVGFVNGFKISTWKPHGILPFSQVLELSNNIGIAKVGQRLGSKLYEHYRRLGFGQKTGINWPAEQSGFVNSPKHWSGQSLISLSFGYEITATLLQLAQAFCIIANHGFSVSPRIILTDNTKPEHSKCIYSKNVIGQIRTILEKTVSQGTARRAAIAGYKIMGKTGTANMVIDGQYSTDHNTYTFAAIIEKGSYKRVLVTFIKEIAQTKDVYASTVAVPLAEKIMEDMIMYEKAF